jgi:acylphosphatase
MTDQPTIRVRVFVEGRVQGVNFRYHTRQEALRLSVAGWVRNLPDGRVEAVYEGAPDAVEEMLSWTRLGPDWAKVTGVTLYDETPKGEVTFSIA